MPSHCSGREMDSDHLAVGAPALRLETLDHRVRFATGGLAASDFGLTTLAEAMEEGLGV